MAKLRDHLQEWLDGVFPKRRVALSAGLRSRLSSSPLHVIDVGGALGREARWRPLPDECIRFMAFEPDNRSIEEAARGSGASDVIMPVGLADRRGERALFLTAAPFASSLYPPNESVLRDFATWPWYEPAGQTTIPVDTLDDCLAQRPDFRADFVKIDVEGADLDVLRGGVSSVRAAFGVQVEVAFVQRNRGAPLQGEVDGWLRGAGFSLHLLEREHWVRTNAVHGALSRPQLIWADAIYFRDRHWVLERLKGAATPAEAESRLAAITAILLVYGAHDYANELISAAASHRLIDKAAETAYLESVSSSLISVGVFAVRGSVALAAAIAISVPLALFGARGRAAGRQLTAAQAGPLFAALARSAQRCGLDRSCLPDV